MGNKQSAPSASPKRSPQVAPVAQVSQPALPTPSGTRRTLRRSLARLPLRRRRSPSEGAGENSGPDHDPGRRPSAATSVFFQREVLSDSRQLARIGTDCEASHASVIMMPESLASAEHRPGRQSPGASLGIPAEHILDTDPNQPLDKVTNNADGEAVPEQRKPSYAEKGKGRDTSQPQTAELETTGPQASGSRPQTAGSTGDRPRMMSRSQTDSSKATGSRTITPSQTATGSGSQTITPSQSTGSRTMQIQTLNPSQPTESQADPDAITPVPPAEEKLASPGPTDSVHEHSEGPEWCGLCERPYRNPIGYEKKAYLPCGHSFGSECLFNWIDGGSNGPGHQICPSHDCIPIRHACEHLSMPAQAWPTQLFRNGAAPVIPWNCEFCETPKGQKIFRKLQNGTRNAAAAEAQLNENQSWASRPYRQVHQRVRQRRLESHYKKLERMHDIWWRKMWASRWGKLILDL